MADHRCVSIHVTEVIFRQAGSFATSATPGLCHSALKDRLRRHTRTPPGDREDAAFCRCSHEGAPLPGTAARGYKPPRSACSRAQDTARLCVQTMIVTVLRPQLKDSPRPAILAAIGCGKTDIFGLFRPPNNSHHDACD